MAEFVQGGLHWRDNGFLKNGLDPVGREIEFHTHNFDHTLFIGAGKYRLEAFEQAFGKNGEPLEDRWWKRLDANFAAPNFIHIKATWRHKITCLEPGMTLCIHSFRDPHSGEPVPVPNFWMQAVL